MIQRLGIAQALLNEPDLLVFDEPSEGLDLPGRQLVRDLVGAQKARGGSVVFVSHLLSEVELFCDRVGIMVAGRLQFLGATAALRMDPRTGQIRTLEAAMRTYYS